MECRVEKSSNCILIRLKIFEIQKSQKKFAWSIGFDANDMNFSLVLLETFFRAISQVTKIETLISRFARSRDPLVGFGSWLCVGKD